MNSSLFSGFGKLQICNNSSTGANKDYVVIGSDSGKISVVEFDLKKNDWKVVHCEVFGKSGCRRIVPGQYLAADPKGRAILIGRELQYFIEN